MGQAPQNGEGLWGHGGADRGRGSEQVRANAHGTQGPTTAHGETSHIDPVRIHLPSGNHFADDVANLGQIGPGPAVGDVHGGLCKTLPGCPGLVRCLGARRSLRRHDVHVRVPLCQSNGAYGSNHLGEIVIPRLSHPVEEQDQRPGHRGLRAIKPVEHGTLLLRSKGI